MDAGMEHAEPEEDLAHSSQDLSHGYCIELYANPDGSFTISQPKPKEPDEEQSEGQSAASLPDALKLILKTVKDNPLSGNPEDEMQAGYMAGPAGKMKAGM